MSSSVSTTTITTTVPQLSTFKNKLTKSKSFASVKSCYHSAVATLARSTSTTTTTGHQENSSGERPKTMMINGHSNLSNSSGLLSGSSLRPLSWIEKKYFAFRKGRDSRKEHSSQMSFSSSSRKTRAVSHGFLQRNSSGITTSSSPDLTIIFGSDGTEWSNYLSECFANAITIQQQESKSPTSSSSLSCPTSTPLTIVQEKLEEMTIPVPILKRHCFTEAGTVLLIISPDFLDYIEVHPEVYELCSLLDPRKTLAMLCGVESRDVSPFHRAALVTYDQWPVLVAKDQDKDFVLTLIERISEILSQQTTALVNENDTGVQTKATDHCPRRSSSSRFGIFSITESRSPQFKLSPRKVKEGSGKVFIMLTNGLKEKQKAHVFLESSHQSDSNHIKELAVKVRNPFTLQVTIPDKFLQFSQILSLTIYLSGDPQPLGTRPLKCESRMSELYELLSTVNSPFEFLNQTLGLSSLSEVDKELTKRFILNLPRSGFSLLGQASATDSGGGQLDYRKKSNLELPTLLHFSARYGLLQFTKHLLSCPEASKATKIRNCRGLDPAHLASQYGHTEIVKTIEDFVSLSKTTLTKTNFLYLNTEDLVNYGNRSEIGPVSRGSCEESVTTDYGSCQASPASEDIIEDEVDYLDIRVSRKGNNDTNNNNGNNQNQRRKFSADYDLLPAGPPIPVFRKPLRQADDGQSFVPSNPTVSQSKARDPADLDYDVPKGLHLFRRNVRKLGAYQNLVSKI